MDAFSGAIGFLRAGLDFIWQFIDNYTVASSVVTCLISLVICILLLDKGGVIFGYVVLAFLGAAVYFLILSIDVVRTWTSGEPFALAIAALAILSRINYIWQRSKLPGRAFTLVIAIALILVVLPIAGNIYPDLPVAGQFSAALSRTGDFIERLSTGAQDGLRSVR